MLWCSKTYTMWVSCKGYSVLEKNQSLKELEIEITWLIQDIP